MKRLLSLLCISAILAWAPVAPAWSASDNPAGNAAKPAIKKAAKKTAKKISKAKKPQRAMPERLATQAAPRPAAIIPYMPVPAPIPTAAAAPAPAPTAPASPAPFTFSPPFPQTSAAASVPSPSAAPMPAFAPWQGSAVNPYLAHAAKLVPTPTVVAPAAAGVAAVVTPAAPTVTPNVTAAPTASANLPSFSLRGLLPDMPPSDQSILPTIKKVQPTGEKPLYVLTFKCPTELIGITPIPTKALHHLVDGAFNVVNSTNLLPFNMQQVCQ